jgi:hypothetical protein
MHDTISHPNHRAPGNFGVVKLKRLGNLPGRLADNL